MQGKMWGVWGGETGLKVGLTQRKETRRAMCKLLYDLTAQLKKNKWKDNRTHTTRKKRVGGY